MALTVFYPPFSFSSPGEQWDNYLHHPDILVHIIAAFDKGKHTIAASGKIEISSNLRKNRSKTGRMLVGFRESIQGKGLWSVKILVLGYSAVFPHFGNQSIQKSFLLLTFCEVIVYYAFSFLK